MRSLLGRLGRQVVVGGAGLALLAGMAIPAAAAPRAFEATVTDGLLVIGLVPNALGGLPECIDGTDGEYLAPFTPGLDGAVDWPADPDCDNILDGDERVAGNQSAVPVTMSGVVDDVSGTISGVTVAFADSTLAIDGGPGVGPVGVKNSVSQTGSGSGSYVPATGAIDLGGSLDLTFNIEMCIPAFGCTAAAFPGGLSGTGGSAPYWTARCHVAIEPDTFSTASIGGDPWNTVADDTFPIAAPADFGAGEGGGGTVPCVVLAGSFGLPGSGALSTTIRSGAVVGLTGSYFRVGDAITVEPGAGGSSKLTFPVETWPAAAGSDLTFEIASIDVTATDDVKECSDKIDNDADTTIDYGSKVTNDTDCGSKLDDDEATPGDQLTVSDYKALAKPTKIKFGKIKVGKTSGKINVKVYGDASPELVESFVVSISNLSQARTFKDLTGVGTIVDNGVAANTVSVGSVLVAPEGAGKASAPVTLAGGTAAADITVTYCLAPITATETDDYKGVSCLSPKTKTIKTGKSSTAITVKIVDDSDPEADEAVGVVLMGVSGGGATMGNATGVVNIADND